MRMNGSSLLFLPIIPVALFFSFCNQSTGVENSGNGNGFPVLPGTLVQGKFTIPDKSLTTLKVYDVFGREVALLVNEEKMKGENEIEFDTGKLPSGVYVYRLVTNNYVDAKNMIVIT